MNRIAMFVVENARLAWALALTGIAATALLASGLMINYQQQEQLSRLQATTTLWQ